MASAVEIHKVWRACNRTERHPIATNVECVVWVSRVQLEFARASLDRFKHHFWVKAHTVVGDFCSGFGKQVTGFWQQKVHAVVGQDAQ